MPDKPSYKRVGTMAATVAEAEARNFGVGEDSIRAAAEKAKGTMKSTATNSTRSKRKAAETVEEAPAPEPEVEEQPEPEENEEESAPTVPKLKKKGTMAVTVAEATERGFGAKEGGRSAAVKAKDSMKNSAPPAKRGKKNVDPPAEEANADIVEEPENDEEAEAPEEPKKKPARAVKKGTMAITVEEAETRGFGTMKRKTRSAAAKASESIKAAAPNSKKVVGKKTETKKTDAKPRISRKSTMAATASEGEKLLEEEGFKKELELLGTAVMPATIFFLLYLIIYSAVTGVVQIMPMVLLACMLGLPGVLIVITTRKVVYVLWMFVYLLALPIWNFVLPVYAFAHFDDFSWGQTRKVAGEDQEKTHGEKEGEFDHAGLVLKKWKEWEIERRGNVAKYNDDRDDITLNDDPRDLKINEKSSAQ
ncbi:Chitin synthase, class 3, partial [Nowakowskiella sp. JEL0407]